VGIAGGALTSPGSAGDQVSDDPGVLPRLDVGKPTREEVETDARKRIAYLLVCAYVIVLAFNMVPITVYVLSTHDLKPGDVRDLTATMTALASAVATVLGFVLGYYFKAIESPDAPKQRKRKKI
jgi:hypothetical protein